MSDLVWTLPAQPNQTARWEESSGGGGGGPSTDTTTVTTDANTFEGEHIFDLGAFSVVSATITFVSGDGDGETFGESPGDICVLGDWVQSVDGVTWVSVPSLWASVFDDVDANGNMSSADQFEVRPYPTPRYIRLKGIIGDSNSNPYAGPNNPTATLRLDVEYL